ncbi:XRE family transcriptional regulator [Streptomyces bauhiniae]
MGENEALRLHMERLGVKQDELVDRLNDAVWDLTGSPGHFTSRTIRTWLSGAAKRPAGKSVAALERVFGCPVTDLGFTAPRSMQQAPEVPVRRRKFFATTTGTAVGSVPVIRRTNSVGFTDVRRMSEGMNALVEADDRSGGKAALAEAALRGRASVMDLQQGSASEKVRRSLYGLAAEYTVIAAWAWLDNRELSKAETYLHESTTLAGLSQEPATEMRVWTNITMLAYQRQRWTEQLAAAQALLSSTAARRDSFYSALGRVRLALAYATLGDVRASERALGTASQALGRVREGERPRWTAFFGESEVSHLAAIVYNHNGRHDQAEYMAHRALAGMPEAFRRNRALVTCQLALAQLHQGDVEQATHTAGDVFAIMNGGDLPGRMRSLVGDFHRDLFRLAGSSTHARDWADRMREEWSRA